MALVTLKDYAGPAGWASGVDGTQRARWYCEQLEEGQILLFGEIPFDLPEADRKLLLGLRQSGSQYHKNISYRPQEDVLRGFASERPEDVKELHRIVRSYS